MIRDYARADGMKKSRMEKHKRVLWSPAFWDAVNPVVVSVGFHKAEIAWVGQRGNLTLPDFDIWFAAAGRGKVCINGQWRDYRAGDLIVLKPGEVFLQERADDVDPFQNYWLHVLPFGHNDHGWNAALASTCPFRMSMLHRPELPTLFNDLFESHATAVNGQSLTVKGLTLQLLDVIFEELRKPESVKPIHDMGNLLRAKQIIEANHPSKLTLASLAAKCELSASHLSMLFTRHFGCPPIEYLVRVRVREAKLLLAKGMRCKAIAAAVGFNSQHYFTRAFQQRTGMTPTMFAARYNRQKRIKAP
jgi:AraC-like DNA-binding protein